MIELKNGDIIKGKIIENIINEKIRVELQGGSILTYPYSQIERITIEEKPSRTFGSGNQVTQQSVTSTPVRDCYNDGYASGQSVGTGGAFASSFVGGFVLGLIGWGISYVAVAGSNPQPSNYDMSSLDDNCKRDYRQGYKEGALEVKKSSVNIGGALGTLLILSIALNASSDTGY